MEDRHRLGLVLIVCGTILMLAACGTLLFHAYLNRKEDVVSWATAITIIPGVVMLVLGIWRSR